MTEKCTAGHPITPPENWTIGSVTRMSVCEFCLQYIKHHRELLDRIPDKVDRDVLELALHAH